MEYNSVRKDLVLPEYGRAVHRMVDHLKTIQDRDERNKASRTIIEIMGNKNPHLRDVEDFTHKLWDHLFIMAEFDLDVDSPYPLPELKKDAGPIPLSYSDEKQIKYKFYGRNVINIVNKASEMEEGKEKEALIEVVANLMKKFYLNYNKESVEDEMINNHLLELSGGKLRIKDEYNIDSTSDILSQKNKKRRRNNNNKNFRKKKNR